MPPPSWGSNLKIDDALKEEPGRRRFSGAEVHTLSAPL